MENFKENFGQVYYSSLPTLAQSMCEILKFFSCKRIYGVGGDYAANLIKALEKNFELLPSSNEMHAGFSACADAEVTGLGVCLTTFTVGSLPCTTAAALAKAEGLPVIFLSGAPAETEVDYTAPLHHTVSPSHAWKVEFNVVLNAFSALGIRAERLQGSRNAGQPGVANEQLYRLILYALEKKNQS